MKNKLVYKYIGKVLITFSIILLLPILVSLIYKENIISFLVPGIISLIIGFILDSIKVDNKTLYAKDGFIIVALSWIVISIIGALPFVFSKSCGLVNGIFETVSGITTTGASIFEDVEVLSNGILFWRSLLHFIGGMGVLAFVMAIIPLSRKDKSMHLLKAEMPGHSVVKLVPSIKKTLLYLYVIYVGLTVIEIVLLLLGGMKLFDSILISFGTAGTGGFSLLNSSLANYSVFCKYVVAIFMFLFGVNFNIYFLIIMKDIKGALKSEELRVYTFIFVFSVIFIFINTLSRFTNIYQAFTEAFFHVSSIITSTGYSIGDINIYPTNCRVLFLLLMIISACAGSTCGGFKVSRLIIFLKAVKRNILKAIHPNSVRNITFEGKKIDEETVKSTCSFMLLYVVCLIVSIFIISFDKYDLERTINAVFCTFGNVGLSFGISNFNGFSVISKLVLSLGMLLGRLEIMPMIVLFSDIKK